MRNRLWLPLTEAKCIASACRHPIPCARRDIPQEKGRPLADFSQPSGYICECRGPNWAKHIPYSQAVRPEDKPAVKEWIGS